MNPWTVGLVLALGGVSIVIAETSGTAGALGAVAGIALVLVLVHAAERWLR